MIFKKSNVAPRVVGQLICCLTVGISLFLSPLSGWGQDKIPLLQLKNTPTGDSRKAANLNDASQPTVMSEGPVFQFYGKLDDLQNNHAVISDSTMYFATDIVFRSENKSTISISQFRVGDQVGYELDDKKRLKSLWLIKSARK